MNSEQQQIIDEAYENYYEYMRDDRQWELDKEEFINKCKTDLDFSQKWGLKIEERELSLGKRNQIGNFDYAMCDDSLIYPTMEYDRKKYKELFDKENIPTKLITITYKNETVITYE